MSVLTYKIVQHDGGWAYRADGTYSETFPTHRAALAAAHRAIAEQRVPDARAEIEWEDENGRWHTESVSGSDRPVTELDDAETKDR
jgi:Uncharacterized protein conserved in bacteria (DUF2188)